MNITKLQFFLRLKQFNGVIINSIIRFNKLSSTSFYTLCNDCNKPSCMHVTKNLIFDQQPALLNKNVIKQYRSRVQNNFPYMSHCCAILNNREKYIGYKSCYGNQYYNSVRYFSNVNIETVTETKVQTQFSGIFKTISESVPIKIAQDSLLWVHDYTGLPWWSIIVLTTIIMRTTVTLPLSLYQQYIIAKLENLKYEMDEIIKELKQETSYGIYKFNWSKEYARRLYNHSVKKQWNKLIVRENCHPAKTSLLVLVQIPLWISLSFSLRNLCYMLPKQDADAYTTYQEFTTDGFLWISNLTVADPFVLPIAMGLFNLTIIEITRMSSKKELTNLRKYLTYFFRIVAIGMIPVAMYVPSCVTLYWATSSAFGLLQNLILLSPRLRRFAKVPVTASELSHPYALLYKKIMARCRLKKKGEISS